MAKNKLKYPANGTVDCFDFFFKTRCNTNEKSNPKTNNIKKDTLEKLNAKAKNSSPSPSPKVLEMEVLSFSQE